QTIPELSTLTVTNTASDSDLPANSLTFSLLSGPTGVHLDSTTGLLTWTPTEAQSPSTNLITRPEARRGGPALKDTKSFNAVENERNSTPTLTSPPHQTIPELSTLTVTNSASDTDLPANSLTFSLLSGPTGVHLDSGTGLLTWTPTESQGPSTNLITVRVTDNGKPTLTDTKSFTVVML